MVRLPLLLVAAVALAGCLPEDADRCDTAGSELAITASPDGTVDGAITIEGTVTSECTVRRVEVGPWRAVADTPNFAGWSVAVPLDDLRAAALRAGADPDATFTTLGLAVSATLYDGEVLGPDEPLAIDLQLRSEIRVVGLDLDVEYPAAPDGSSLCSVPDTGSDAAWVEVTADPESAGGTLEISTTAGSFVGEEHRTISRELERGADADDRAFAAARLTATSPGTAFLVVTAEGESDEEVARITGPPTFVPAASTTVTRGETFEILVRSTGTLATCIVIRESGTVTSATLRAADGTGSSSDVFGTSVLVDTPAADCDDYSPTPDQVVAVTFDAESPPGAVSLICDDAHGGEQLGTYRLGPAGD